MDNIGFGEYDPNNIEDLSIPDLRKMSQSHKIMANPDGSDTNLLQSSFQKLQFQDE